MQLNYWINVAAILISPAIATGVGLWIGEIMRARTYQKEREEKLLEQLMTYRYAMPSPGFLGALNSINQVFHKNLKIKSLVKDLHRAFSNTEVQSVLDQRIVELIYEICRHKGYDVTEHEIHNTFSILIKPPLSQSQPVQQPTNPAPI